jgi:glycosyltransferase involved in cell wall biosynthesis
MKIAVFTDTYSPQINGVTNTLTKLVHFFKQSGIIYQIYAPRYEHKDLEQNINRYYSLKFFLYPESRVTVPSLSHIQSSLYNFKPDLIHLMTECNMGLGGLHLSRKLGIPAISNYSTNFTLYTGYFKLSFLEQAVWNYLRWFHMQSPVTLCPSMTTKQLLADHGIDNTTIFSRGIDCSQFHPRHKNYNLLKSLGILGKTVFLYVGRLSPEKDLDVLWESYQYLHYLYPEQTALIVTGEGPLLKKCKSMLPPDTIYTGFLRGIELSEIYASADIFLASSSSETFGNVVLEAMASGLAVIGADTGGIGEIIRHRITGLKFKSRNSKELTDCMIELMKDIDLRDYLKSNAWEYALHNTWEKVFHRLRDTYQTVLNRDYAKISCP